MLGVFPSRLVGGYVAFGTFLERQPLGVLRGLRGLPTLSFVDRVNTAADKIARIGGHAAGFGQGDKLVVRFDADGTKAHFASAPGHHIAEYPRLGIERGDLQIEAATVSIETGRQT